jgi:soluble lytic murein transglycosylase
MSLLPALFLSLTTQYNLPPKLLDSVCYIESHYDVKAVHKDDGGENSLGVCQVKLSTAKFLGFKGSEAQLMRPEVNAKYAAKYIKYQLNRYEGNIEKAIISYNRGNAKGLTRTKYSLKVLKVYWRLNDE